MSTFQIPALIRAITSSLCFPDAGLPSGHTLQAPVQGPWGWS